jgi:hypothetical protein
MPISDRLDTRIEAGLVLDCLDFDILIVSEDYRILFANKAFLSKIRMAKGDVIGKHCYEITHHIKSPCKPPSDPCPLAEVMKTERPAVEVHAHLSKDNKKFLVNVTAAPIMEEGKRVGFLHIALPVDTKEKRADSLRVALGKTMDVLNVVNLYQRQMTDLKEKTSVLEKTKKDLELKIEALEKFSRFTVGREVKMVELKSRIAELESHCLSPNRPS